MSALELVESSELDDILDMPVAVDDADLIDTVDSVTYVSFQAKSKLFWTE